MKARWWAIGKLRIPTATTRRDRNCINERGIDRSPRYRGLLLFFFFFRIFYNSLHTLCHHVSHLLRLPTHSFLSFFPVVIDDCFTTRTFFPPFSSRIFLFSFFVSRDDTPCREGMFNRGTMYRFLPENYCWPIVTDSPRAPFFFSFFARYIASVRFMHRDPRKW